MGANRDSSSDYTQHTATVHDVTTMNKCVENRDSLQIC